MKKGLFVIVIAALIGGTGQVKGQDRDVLLKVGDKVPEFEVQLLDGGKLTMTELRGKVVLLNFWATWCPPCIEEFARVKKEVIDRFEGKDFYFLAISREDTREQIEAFREKTGHRFTMGLDPRRGIFSKFATASIPRDFVVTREGKIAHMMNGYSGERFEAMVRVIEGLLDE
jgi:peroxiredoxin